MQFADIIGNAEAVKNVRALVDGDKIPHALLLSGPSGIGKMRLARAFISYINCENRSNGDSCGQCPSCRRINANNNPDIHYFYPIYKLKSKHKELSQDYAEEWKEFLETSPYMDPTIWLSIMNAENSQPRIYVGDANEISHVAALSPYADRFKIFVIWLPERLEPAAANKLLKVLEEPYEDTLFIAVSNDPASILPTIYSRLQRVEMRRPSTSVIENALVMKGISPQAAPVLANLAEGSLLKASQLAAAEGETQEFASYFQNMMRCAYARQISALRSAADNLAALGREKSIRLLDYFARMTRENFIANLCVPPLNVMTPQEADFSSRFAPFINAANVEEIISHIDLARRDISRNANAKLVWFDFALLLMISLRKK